MPPSLPVVTIVGINGVLASSVINALFSRYKGKFALPVHLVTRDEAKTKALPFVAASPSSFKLHKADVVTGEGLAAAFKGATVAVNLVGVTSFSHNAIANAVVAAGVPVYIPSEFGSDVSPGQFGPYGPIFRVKAQNGEYVRTLPIKSVFISNGFFTEYVFSVPGLGGFTAEGALTTYEPDAAYATTSIRDVGRTIAAVVAKSAEPASLPDQVVVRGDTLTGKRVAEIYTKVTGNKVDFKIEPAAKILEPAAEIVKTGFSKTGDKFFVILMALLTQGYSNFTPNSGGVIEDNFAFETAEDVARRIFKKP